MGLEAKEREEFVRAWGTILMKSWEDDEFKARFHEDPKSVMDENGLEVQDDARINLEAPPEYAGPDLELQIQLYEEGRETGTYLFYVQEANVLRTQEISEAELEGVAAGACSSEASCCSCP
jgi:hypothetical protein